MGNRFYEQQKKHKPKRRLKKDIIAEVTFILGREVSGLDRLTIASLDELIEALQTKWYQMQILEAATDAEIVEVENE